MLVRSLKHPATVIATVALLVAAGGGAAAYASGLINGSQIKNHSISAKKLTKAAITSLSTLGYAHINSDGTFDAAHSWNVTAANISRPATGVYCFNGLSFTPKNVEVTGDYNGVFNGQIPSYLAEIPGKAGDCETTKQAMVFTGLITPGGFTPGKNIGFFVSFN